MSFSINTNVTSLQAQTNLRSSSDFQSKTINRVTSGLRIVNSGDDAAGLAIANGYRSDQSVLTQGIRNANDGLSTLQTIDGGMNNISMLLDRARTLAAQSASGTFSGDRSNLNSEFQNVVSEIDRQSTAIGMNTGGQFAKSLSVFIGGGKGLSSTDVINNGSVSLDLSHSTVDANSLGLSTFRAVTPTNALGVSYDLSATSATSVSKILGSAAGNTSSEAAAGSTKFTFRGAAFSDSKEISISVNVAGVTDTTSLVNAINSQITSAANPTTATTATTAFKNAGITASIVTNSNGQQELAFNSTNTAFQVSADDRVSNAFMGNFENASIGLGKAPNVTTTNTLSVGGVGTGGTAELTITMANGDTGRFSFSVATGDSASVVAASINAVAAASVSTGTFAMSQIKAFVDSSGKIGLMSTNGQSFIATETTTTGSAAVTAEAMGQTAGPLASSVNSSTFVSGGVQASSEAGTLTSGSAFNFTALSAGATQDVTFAGTHTDGTQYTFKTTLTAAGTTDVATTLKTLNASLQASADPSLQKIVAIADNDSAGGLGVKFVSPDAFSVTIAADVLGSGNGLSGLRDTSATAPVQNGAVLQSVTTSGAGAADVSNQTSAAAAVTALAGAVSALGAAQANVGKGQNQFNYAMNLAQSQSTNLASAESRIRDADLASEAANLTKAQILIQAGTAALAQANSAPQAILSLLK